MDSSPESSGTQTVSRAISILRAIATKHSTGLRLVDIARITGLSSPTVLRILNTLISEGMVSRRKGSRHYLLGALVFELGLAAAHNFNLREICRPALQRLAERTGDTSFLFVRNGNDSVCLDRVQGTFPIQTPLVPIGSRQPLGVNAGGLALLSSLSDSDAKAVINDVATRLDAYNNFDRNELLRLRAQARKQGYALIGNKAVPGVTAIGLPIYSRSGDVAIGAVTIATTSSRMNESRIKQMLPHLRDTAEEISGLLQQ